MSCPICQKRNPSRFCPARGETICAVCCGTEREVTIDCPSDCPYLIRARQSEDAHSKALAAKDAPFPDVRIPARLLELQQPLVTSLALSLLEFARENRPLQDADAAVALGALAETYRTLNSGLYYEKPPEGGPARGLYAHLAESLEKLKKQEAARTGSMPFRDSDAHYVLVFFTRLVHLRSSGRPKSRAFLDFLRVQFPQAAAPAEASRIITP
jgi:hypothetical protein